MAKSTSKKAPTDQPKQSLVDRTLAQLVEIIIASGANALIAPQDELAKQFSVSRTVVREALSTLEFLNVIAVRPKTGTRINPPDQWKVFNHEVLQWRQRAGGSSGLMQAVHLERAAPDLLEVLVELTDIEGPLPGNAAWHGRAMAAIAKAEGR